MEGIQGAVLRVKLKHLSDWNNSRRRHAKLYNELKRRLNKKRLPIEKREELEPFFEALNKIHYF